MSRKIILLSGGVDSMVILAMLFEQSPLCVTFDYNQRHRREIDSARAIASHYNAEHVVVKIPSLRGSCLTGECEVPDANDDQDVTVVPGRNAIMLALAVNCAGPGDEILFGAHGGDFSVYPDCRTDFVEPLSQAFKSAYGVIVSAPWLHKPKSEVIRIGRSLGVPMNLAWTCYRGLDEPCGCCGSCRGRISAEAMA